ncbi:MAG: helix-turn-helix transcriptional regulator [Phycisphaeraceae bacterium]|nr:helix-turn-helix transcriptional regulator [Phycisphaeraceae bacterium]
MGIQSQDTRMIGRRLTAARRFRGWELDELAKRSGIHPRWIKRYEATGDIACDDLAKLASTLRFPFSHFVERCCLCGKD